MSQYLGSVMVHDGLTGALAEVYLCALQSGHIVAIHPFGYFTTQFGKGI